MVPVSVSMKDRVIADLFHLIVEIAMDPSLATPGSKGIAMPSRTMLYITVTAVSAAVIAAAVMGWRVVHRQPLGGGGGGG
ncbi:hypothetical protein HDU67_002792, partial [Dinochytrium kinnereticum]